MPARGVRAFRVGPAARLAGFVAALALVLGPPALAQRMGSGVAPQSQWSGAPCSGHGHIDIGRCFCDPRWSGADCATPEAPPDCGAHGQARDDRCVCAPGWKGHACQKAAAPACPHGKLATGECA